MSWLVLFRLIIQSSNLAWGMLTLDGGTRLPYNLSTAPVTGCFHDKAIISKENIGLDCYLLLKYCRRQYVLYFPLPGPNHLQNLTPKCKILNVFWI